VLVARAAALRASEPGSVRAHATTPPLPPPTTRPAQVIADTAAIVEHVRRQWGVPAAVPSVVIGGSYGGMLAAYHRVVRPDAFHAAIASSAPIHYLSEWWAACLGGAACRHATMASWLPAVQGVSPLRAPPSTHACTLARTHKAHPPTAKPALCRAHGCCARCSVGTPMWRETSIKYHQFVEDAVTAMSGSRSCAATIKAALARCVCGARPWLRNALDGCTARISQFHASVAGFEP
jgi:pimeloyl-ACP methyl ester carboxylesterase